MLTKRAPRPKAAVAVGRTAVAVAADVAAVVVMVAAVVVVVTAATVATEVDMAAGAGVPAAAVSLGTNDF